MNWRSDSFMRHVDRRHEIVAGALEREAEQLIQSKPQARIFLLILSAVNSIDTEFESLSKAGTRCDLDGHAVMASSSGVDANSVAGADSRVVTVLPRPIPGTQSMQHSSDSIS